MICFAIVAWLVVIIQCFTGTDVLRWRSFYATHDTAWRAHYLEVFDHGIREALCCLGRVKYMYDLYFIYLFYFSDILTLIRLMSKILGVS